MRRCYLYPRGYILNDLGGLEVIAVVRCASTAGTWLVLTYRPRNPVQRMKRSAPGRDDLGMQRRARHDAESILAKGILAGDLGKVGRKIGRKPHRSANRGGITLKVFFAPQNEAAPIS